MLLSISFRNEESFFGFLPTVETTPLSECFFTEFTLSVANVFHAMTSLVMRYLKIELVLVTLILLNEVPLI